MELVDVIGDVPEALLTVPAGRRELTKYDPLLFAAVYLPHHLKNPQGEITLSDFHLDLVEYGKTWVRGVTKPKEYRDAFIAPRESGKSTWLFTILPLWAAAHEHIKFIAAYSDSAAQAQGHLMTFKNELSSNALLQTDFPKLTNVERSATNRAMADNNFKTVRENGFVFTASGVDVSNHGIKHGAMRPQVIILDDIEPGESNYSLYQMKQRLNTIWDDIAPQNIFARMVIVGTTTMAGSIIDQLRKYGEEVGLRRYTDPDANEDVDVIEELKWVKQQNIRVNYYPAIMVDDNGKEYSLWEEKWPLEWLDTQRNLRDFAKNYLNRPISSGGQFWDFKDIQYGESDYGNTIVSVDPAVTRSKVSDYTGLAVLSRGENGIYVRYANQVKQSGAQLAETVQALVDEYGAGLVYVETNQGGDLWRDVFANVNARFRAVRQTVSKEIRAGKALNVYQRGKVFHTEPFQVLHEQLLSFPATAHDDVLDAVVSGVLYFEDGSKGAPVRAAQVNYAGV